MSSLHHLIHQQQLRRYNCTTEESNPAGSAKKHKEKQYTPSSLPGLNHLPLHVVIVKHTRQARVHGLPSLKIDTDNLSSAAHTLTVRVSDLTINEIVVPTNKTTTHLTLQDCVLRIIASILS